MAQNKKTWQNLINSLAFIIEKSDIGLIEKQLFFAYNNEEHYLFYSYIDKNDNMVEVSSYEFYPVDENNKYNSEEDYIETVVSDDALNLLVDHFLHEDKLKKYIDEDVLNSAKLPFTKNGDRELMINAIKEVIPASSLHFKKNPKTKTKPKKNSNKPLKP